MAEQEQQKLNIGKASLIGGVMFIVVIMILAFFPAIPIPLTDGKYFYLVMPDIQALLKTMLYFIFLIAFQSLVIFGYIKLFKFVWNYAGKLKTIPLWIERKIKKLMG
jgi:hypothetical protein